MQSAWNSWPQGSLITLLTPSTYSSKHTTHSTCLPMYFFHSAEMAPRSCPERPARGWGFVGGAGRLLGVGATKFALSKTPVVVLERGRGLGGLGLGLDCKSGVVDVALGGEGILGDRLGDRATVWYVLTGNRSTTDLGALHLLRRILARRTSRAYTMESVTRGLMTRTRSVSKNGLALLVGVMVTQRPS